MNDAQTQKLRPALMLLVCGTSVVKWAKQNPHFLNQKIPSSGTMEKLGIAWTSYADWKRTAPAFASPTDPELAVIASCAELSSTVGYLAANPDIQLRAVRLICNGERVNGPDSPTFGTIVYKLLRGFLGGLGIQVSLTTRKFGVGVGTTGADQALVGFERIVTWADKHIATFRQKNPQGQIVWNATSGYKAYTAMMTLWAAAEADPDATTVYLYENSAVVQELGTLPVHWDIAALDELGPWMHAHPPKVPDDIFRRYRGLFKNQKGTLSVFGLLLKARRCSFDSSRSGYGAWLLERLSSTRKAQLEALIRGRWNHLWVGDQIPETVEHSRGHSTRLVQFLGMLLWSTSLDLEQEDLFLLLAAIWLHDIGHGMVESTKSWPGQSPQNGPLPVGLFPTLVRKYHNEFTDELLASYPNLFWGEVPHAGDTTQQVVRLICKYHRQSLLLSDFKSELHNITADSEEIRRYTRLAALLKFLDGCDVQTKRTVDEDYREVRHHRLLLEAVALARIALHNSNSSLQVDGVLNKIVKMLPGDLGAVSTRLAKELTTAASLSESTWEQTLIAAMVTGKELDWYSRLDKIQFKLSQPEHFEKHAAVDWVGVSGDLKKKSKVTLLPSEGAPKATLNQIVADIKKEYSLVEDVLKEDFSLAVVIA